MGSKYNARKGVYKIRNKSKYRGKSNPVWRSSWERKAFEILDRLESVVEWSSEQIPIKYYCKQRKTWHTYYPDLWLKVIDKNGMLRQHIIEIKPSKQTQKPNPPKTERGKRRYIYEYQTYLRNESKWEFAEEYCNQNNIKFSIWTEYELGIRT